MKTTNQQPGSLASGLEILLIRYYLGQEDNVGYAVRDLLADLKRFCDKNDIDIKERLNAAIALAERG